MHKKWVLRVVKGLIAVSAVSAVGVFAYHRLSPKVLVLNHSANPISNVQILLPDNRVIFSEINPNDSAIIYFSPQHESGIVKYSLSMGQKSYEGMLDYSAENQLARIIQVTVDSEEKVSLEILDALSWI